MPEAGLPPVEICPEMEAFDEIVVGVSGCVGVLLSEPDEQAPAATRTASPKIAPAILP
jgi:hypothetical protein